MFIPLSTPAAAVFSARLQSRTLVMIYGVYSYIYTTEATYMWLGQGVVEEVSPGVVL